MAATDHMQFRVTALAVVLHKHAAKEEKLAHIQNFIYLKQQQPQKHPHSQATLHQRVSLKRAFYIHVSTGRHFYG